MTTESEALARHAGRTYRDLWLLRAVALIISILLCLTVLGGKRVEIIKKFQLDYQLKKGLVLGNQAPQEVQVRVIGPRAFMKEFQDRQSSIPIDLTKFQAGDFEVPLKEEMFDVPLGIKVLSMSQNGIPLRIDYLSSKRVPIRAVFAPGLGEDLKVKSVTFKPSTVEIQGSRGRLITIDAIPTEAMVISNDNAKQDVEVKLTTSDFPGVSIREIDRMVQASIEVEGELVQRLFAKIPIEIRVGSGAQMKIIDSLKRGVKLHPEFASFTLEGSAKKILQMTHEDIEAWVEIPVAKNGLQRSKLVWKLSPDVRVVKRSTDWVDVKLQNEDE